MLEQLAGEMSLLDTVFSQGHIGPAGKAVLLVPSRLAMSNEYDLVNLTSALLHLLLRN